MGHTRVTTTEGYLRNVSQLRLASSVNILDTSDQVSKLLF